MEPCSSMPSEHLLIMKGYFSILPVTIGARRSRLVHAPALHCCISPMVIFLFFSQKKQHLVRIPFQNGLFDQPFQEALWKIPLETSFSLFFTRTIILTLTSPFSRQTIRLGRLPLKQSGRPPHTSKDELPTEAGCKGL